MTILPRATVYSAGRLADRLLMLVLILVMCVAVVRLFFGIDVSSFWQDEIFSARIALQPDLRAMLEAASPDTHPPTYYSLLYFWTGLFGFCSLSARGFSVLLGVGTIIVLLLLPGRSVDWRARLLSCATAVTSWYWFDHVQEVRSYALLMFLLAIVATMSVRIVDGEFGRLGARNILALFAGSAMLATGVHLYGFFASVICCCAVALNAPDRRWRMRALAIVLACVIISGVYAVGVSRHVDIAMTNNMFRTDVHSLRKSSVIGARSIASWPFLVILPLAAGGALIRQMRTTPPRWLLSADAAALRVDIILIAAPLIIAAVGVVTSISIVPNLNYRGVSVAAPLFWVGMARWFGRLENQAPSIVPIVTLLCLGIAIVRTPSLWALNTLPFRQEFRASASFIQRFPACSGQTIPVIRVDGNTSSPQARRTYLNFLESRYGYYTAGRNYHFQMMEVAKGKLTPSPDMTELLDRRLNGSDPCPVLAWLANIKGVTPDQVEHSLATRLDPASGRKLKMRVFLYYVRGDRRLPIRDVAVFFAQPKAERR